MESLYLKWKDYKTGKKYVLGALMKDRENKKYYFKLDKDSIEKAEQAGFNSAVLTFEPDRIYYSTQIFSFFRHRLPKVESMDEEDIKYMLEENDMTEYDDFEFLRKTKGEIMTDDFILEEGK